MNLKFSLKGQGARYSLERVWSGVKAVVYQVFFVRRWIIYSGALVMVAGLALYLVVSLLYLEPPDLELVAEQPKDLNTGLIERLVEWTDDRSRAREVGMVFPSGKLFP